MPKDYPEPIGNGAMWARRSTAGNDYISGVMTFEPSPGAPPVKVNFVAFTTRMKQSDKSPDYIITVNSIGPAPARQPRDMAPRSSAPQGVPMGRPTGDDEDVPF